MVTITYSHHVSKFLNSILLTFYISQNFYHLEISKLLSSVFFPLLLVEHGCESWTVKKAERGRIDAFELWCWRRLLRVPWTARRSSQSILKEITPRISLERMMLKLKSSTLATSCEELTHWKRLWCWEGLGAGGEEDDRGWDGWMASLTRWTWVWVNPGVGDGR